MLPTPNDEHRSLPLANAEGLDTKPASTPTGFSRLRFFIRECFAAAFWIYAITKIFVFDIDRYILSVASPDAAWLLDYKFFIFIGSLAMWLVASKTKNFLLSLLYVFSYPAIILFWRIPAFIWRRQSWTLAFACINAILSFFQSIKYNVVISTLCLISLALILSTNYSPALWVASIVLFALLLLTYIRTFTAVFQPSNLFRAYMEAFATSKERASSAWKLDDTIKNLPVAQLNEDQLKKWSSNLEGAVLFNRLCLFSAKKLKDYQNSGLSIIFGALTALMLVVATTLSFAAINFAANKIDKSLFEASDTSFFTFFYYSFNNLLFNSIKEIIPIKPLSQSLAMAENFFALFLVAIFASLLVTVRSERFSKQIDEIILSANEESRATELFVRDEYQIESIDEAMKELERLQTGLVQILLWLTKNIK